MGKIHFSRRTEDAERVAHALLRREPMYALHFVPLVGSCRTPDGARQLIFERAVTSLREDVEFISRYSATEARSRAAHALFLGMVNVLEGLQILCRVGLVHMDMSPDNVMRAADGRYKLIDFGNAMRTGDVYSKRNRYLDVRFAYNPPEFQWFVRGRHLSCGAYSASAPKADVYAFGVLMRWVGERLRHAAFSRLGALLTEPDPCQRPSAAEVLGMWDVLSARVTIPPGSGGGPRPIRTRTRTHA